MGIRARKGPYAGGVREGDVTDRDLDAVVRVPAAPVDAGQGFNRGTPTRGWSLRSMISPADLFECSHQPVQVFPIVEMSC